ncbi:MAG: DNA repair protein RadC [Roseburia sp.]
MKQHLTMKQLPDSERPYEKYLSCGATALSDAELLAVIIRSGSAGRKAIEVAQDFLNMGDRSLLNLYDVSYEEIKRISGIGSVKAIQLKCIAELSKRIAQTKYRSKIHLNDAASVADYYMEHMRHEKQEKLLLCMFDSKCRLLEDVLLSIGSATSAIVTPREIFLTALRAGAIHIILLHNHPSGSPEPSGEDDAVTLRLIECGRILGIPLSDHIIIGDRSYYSYREHAKFF